MKKPRIAIIGYGRLGKACARAIRESDDIILAGAVLKEDGAASPLPKQVENMPVAGHVSELGQVDVALICVPTGDALGVTHDTLQHGIPIVECASLEAEAFKPYFDELDKVARNHHAAAVVGAGWLPGVATELQDVFALLIPKGRTTQTNRPGAVLHHTAALSQIEGVKDAMSMEAHGAAAVPQRYVYLELNKGADFDKVRQAVLADPFFADGQTQVFEVSSIADMEDEGHGIVIERRGASGQAAHETLLFEARYEPADFVARIMIDAVRTMPYSLHGATRYSLLRS